ncbi:hypothetical protein PAMC26510_35465 [Caballeronia sordidicola]|uniref:Uncharacterized protein n=1 Tax=Caballeronia sordidicola TaxID=196367 RepID=A0A242M5G7_CABSO|nr:hypothetical protein PAMC26510_35465 [Caballeronia sordidicola]
MTTTWRRVEPVTKRADERAKSGRGLDVMAKRTVAMRESSHE